MSFPSVPDAEKITSDNCFFVALGTRWFLPILREIRGALIRADTLLISIRDQTQRDGDEEARERERAAVAEAAASGEPRVTCR